MITTISVYAEQVTQSIFAMPCWRRDEHFAVSSRETNSNSFQTKNAKALHSDFAEQRQPRFIRTSQASSPSSP